MAYKPITTPRGTITHHKTKNGKVVAKLEWNPNFAADRNKSFSQAQKFVDSEVLRHCSPLVPRQTGTLDRSGTLGTVLGSGEVCYIAPYAHDQYYNTPESRVYDGQRGGKWFDRMKPAHKDEILKGAKKYFK